MQKRSVFKLLIAIVLLLMLIWVLSLVYCEGMTVLFGDKLMPMQDFPTMLRAPEYIKVLTYGKKSAKLYYVEDGMAGGHVLSLEKERDAWTVIQWETIWSGTGGSASGILYPYLWHVVYGGL